MCNQIIEQIYEQLYAKFYNYLKDINPQKLTICFIVVSVMLYFCVWLKDRNLKLKKIIYCTLCGAWIVFMIEITLLGRGSNVINTYKTIFSSITEFINGNYNIIYDMIFNVLLFVPFGFFVSLEVSVKYSIILNLITSLSIEIMQFITCRGLFEISDLILNFFGGSLGIIFLKILKKISKK